MDLTQDEIQILKAYKDDYYSFLDFAGWRLPEFHFYDNCSKDNDETCNKLQYSKIPYTATEYKESNNEACSPWYVKKVSELLKELDLFREVEDLRDLEGLRNGLGLVVGRISYDVDDFDKKDNTMYVYMEIFDDEGGHFLEIEAKIDNLKQMGFLFELKEG
ncbi:MAG: hypothetical protein ACRC0V_06630 [Fusobacteriaceae bacterium]